MANFVTIVDIQPERRKLFAEQIARHINSENESAQFSGWRTPLVVVPLLAALTVLFFIQRLGSAAGCFHRAQQLPYRHLHGSQCCHFLQRPSSPRNILSFFAASSSLEIQPILNAQQFVDFPSSEQFCAANYDALSVDGIPP
jgi:hypothetical protein